MNNKLLIVALLFMTSVANASLIEGGWPAPGGNSVSSSGISPGHLGGKTFTISNFDDSFYDELYYGTASAFPPAMGEDGLVDMVFQLGSSDLTNGILVWTNQFNLFNAVSSLNIPVIGQFTLSFTDLSDDALEVVSAASLGLDVNLGGFLNVLDDFKVNRAFTINGQAALPFYDNFSNQPGSHLDTSVGGAFYYTEQSISVPEPSTLAIFALSVMGLASRRFKKKS